MRPGFKTTLILHGSLRKISSFLFSQRYYSPISMQAIGLYMANAFVDYRSGILNLKTLGQTINILCMKLIVNDQLPSEHKTFFKHV